MQLSIGHAASLRDGEVPGAMMQIMPESSAQKALVPLRPGVTGVARTANEVMLLGDDRAVSVPGSGAGPG
jgi:hypothetical protein